MNNQQFIYWLNGFVDAVGEEGPTPKQWETIVSELGKVGETIVYPPYTPNTIPSGPIPRNPINDPGFWYKYPSDINKVTCEGTGTTSGNGVIVTDGFIQNLSVTRAQPPFTLTTTSGSGVIYKVGTLTGNTTTTLPKDTNVNYTANLPEDL